MFTSPSERVDGTAVVVYQLLRESLLTGVVVVVPALITLYLLAVAVQFLVDLLAPAADFVFLLWPGLATSVLLVNAVIAGLLIVLVLAIGFVTQFHAGEVAVATVDGAIRRLPGVGTVYGSFRRLSDAVVAGDMRSFEGVKLLEFPATGTYSIGFVVTESPATIGPELDGEIETLFVPLAPNPVMGGFLVHVDRERTVDVEMTVEEAVSAIVSLGATEAEFAGAATDGSSIGVESPPWNRPPA